MTSLEDRKALLAGRSIRFTLVIDAAPEKIWKALVTPVQMAIWSYPERVEVDRIEPGGVYGFLSGDEADEDGAEILELDPPRYLKLRWFSSEPNPTVLEWVLEPHDAGYTLLHFENSGFQDTAAWKQAYVQDFEGWVALHLNLKKYVETGQVPPKGE